MRSRRKLCFSLAALPALTWMQLAGAQTTKLAAKVVRVGIVRIGPAPATPGALHHVFVETLRELGWTDGRNIVYDVAYGEGERGLDEAAAALVARRPDVIYTSNGPTARAAAKATRTIPKRREGHSSRGEGGHGPRWRVRLARGEQV